MILRILQLTFLMAVFCGCTPFLSQNVEKPGHVENDAMTPDLKTIIAGMQHHDGLIASATGEFIIERYKRGGAETEKIRYALTFEGEKVQIQKRRGWSHSLEEKILAIGKKVVPLVGRAFPIADIYDDQRHWKIYNRKEPLFSIEIPSDNGNIGIETIRQAFTQKGVEIGDNIRIATDKHIDSFTLIDNETDKTYLVYRAEETGWEVYDQHLEYTEAYDDSRLQYAARHQRHTLYQLDPRYWLTYPTIPINSYLIEPMWQLLKKYESQLLETEVLNGEPTSVVQLNLPTVRGTEAPQHLGYQPLKIWIAYEKGFRIVKWERTFTAKTSGPGPGFKKGVTYTETLEFDYHEYLPGIWFPQKIERSFSPIKGVFVPKTVLLTKQCRLNSDVTELFHSVPSPRTPAYGSLRTNVEKLTALHRVFPRVLERRVAALELSREIGEVHRKDPELTLLRKQTHELARDLRQAITRFTTAYAGFTHDRSVFRPGGDFYKLMEQNHIAFGR